ncbi:MAG: hypothetical protein HQM05_16535 [Magnetococcales bacterium]|nr:hypothetical protein [Magnetococcales bacterium]
MEKNLIFEMTVSLLFGPDHKPLFQAAGERYFVNPIIPAIKAPEEILRAIKPGEYVSEATGKAIADWLSGATRDALDEARRMAARGTDAFRAWWPSLSKEDKGLLNQHIQELQAIAAKADVDAQAMDQDSSGAIGEDGGESSADDGNDDALSGGFDSFEDDEESAQVSEPQPVVSPEPVQQAAPVQQTAPVHVPVRPTVTQPPQRVQQTQTPPVTQPPRRAAAPQPSPAPIDLSTDDNPF